MDFIYRPFQVSIGFMTKGITPLLVAILMVILVVFMGTAFLYWGQGMGEDFRNVTEDVTRSQVESSKTNFAIISVSGTEVGVKNKGETNLHVDDFNFYLNDTEYNYISTNPPGVTELNTGDIVIFDLGVGLSSYIVKVSGPYGRTDIVENT